MVKECLIFGLNLMLLCSSVCAISPFQRYKQRVLKITDKVTLKFRTKSDRFALKAHTPDLLFRNLLNKEPRKNKTKSRYEISYSDSSLKDLYKHAQQYETSAGYHIIWAAVLNKNVNMLQEMAGLMKLSGDKLYNIKDSFGNNLMHVCCFLQWTEGIKTLLESADISLWNNRNLLGKTPIDVCKEFERDKSKSALIENAKKGSKIRNIMYEPSKQSKIHKNRKKTRDDDDYFYEEKASNDLVNDASVKRVLGYSLMFFDIFDDAHIKDFQKALRNNGKLLSMKVDKYNNNILHILTLFCKEDFIADIEDIKDAINGQNFLGNTPLHIAVSMNSEPMVSQLLKFSKINLCIKNTSNTIPLTLAIRNYKEHKSEKQHAFEVICHLLNYGDNNGNNQLNITDTHGNTPYHFSCMQLSIKIITELVMHGANVNKKNAAGLTGGDILANKLGNSMKRANGKQIETEKIEAIFSAIELMSRICSKNNAINRNAAIEILGDRTQRMRI